MTFDQARVRIGVYFLLAWVLRLATALILFTVAAKTIYALSETLNCGRPCYEIQNGIASAFNNVFPLLAIWHWLPDVPSEFWYLQLVSSAGMCAAFFMLFTFFLDHERRDLSAVLKEAIFRARVASLDRSSNSQSVRGIQAGGDVHVEQIINTNPDVRDWDSKFTKSPMGQIIIAASGGFLAFLLGKLFGG
jgi:hypothetical protein